VYRDGQVDLRNRLCKTTLELEASEQARQQAEAKVHELAILKGRLQRLDQLASEARRVKREVDALRHEHRGRWWRNLPRAGALLVVAVMAAGGAVAADRRHGLDVEPEKLHERLLRPFESGMPPHVPWIETWWKGRVRVAEGGHRALLRGVCTLHVRLEPAGNEAIGRLVALRCDSGFSVMVRRFEKRFDPDHVMVTEVPGDYPGMFRQAIKGHWTGADKTFDVDTFNRSVTFVDSRAGTRLVIELEEEYGSAVDVPLLAGTLEQIRAFGEAQKLSGRVVKANGYATRPRAWCDVTVAPMWVDRRGEDVVNCVATVRCQGFEQAAVEAMACDRESPVRGRFDELVAPDVRSTGEVDLKARSLRFTRKVGTNTQELVLNLWGE
jgi:hypothetical protein